MAEKQCDPGRMRQIRQTWEDYPPVSYAPSCIARTSVRCFRPVMIVINEGLWNKAPQKTRGKKREKKRK